MARRAYLELVDISTARGKARGVKPQIPVSQAPRASRQTRHTGPARGRVRTGGSDFGLDDEFATRSDVNATYRTPKGGRARLIRAGARRSCMPEPSPGNDRRFSVS